MDKELQLQALEKFRDIVIKNAKNNLRQKSASGKLRDSLNAQVKVMPNSIRLFFEMEEYGFYQDQGVKGVSSGRSLSNFRFGSGSGKKGGLTEGIKKWVKYRSIQFRDKKGRFLSSDATAMLITRSIWQKGIKPSMFFTKPFEQAFKTLPNEMIDAYGLESEELFDTIMKENMKNYGYK
jgi:hypothetical protein